MSQTTPIEVMTGALRDCDTDEPLGIRVDVWGIRDEVALAGLHDALCTAINNFITEHVMPGAVPVCIESAHGTMQ